jgi:hypothetical protein
MSGAAGQPKRWNIGTNRHRRELDQ